MEKLDVYHSLDEKGLASPDIIVNLMAGLENLL